MLGVVHYKYTTEFAGEKFWKSHSGDVTVRTWCLPFQWKTMYIYMVV